MRWGTRSADTVGTKEPCGEFGSYKRQQAPGSSSRSGEHNSEVPQPLGRSPTAKIKCFVNPHRGVLFCCRPVCSVHPYRPRSWPPTWMKASGEKQAEANQAATNIHPITCIRAGKTPSAAFISGSGLRSLSSTSAFILPEILDFLLPTPINRSLSACEKASAPRRDPRPARGISSTEPGNVHKDPSDRTEMHQNM